MKILHLTASPFYGGPERVILDLVRRQSAPEFGVESLVVSFRENGGSDAFLEVLRQAGFPGKVLKYDMPHLVAAVFELGRLLRKESIDLICAHGHKSRFVGWLAARRTGIPIVGVSHGWTWQDWKTSLYERLDQWVHRRMDRVVCVSKGQAEKVARAGTPPGRIVVIYNGIDATRFAAPPDPSYRRRLESYFETPPRKIVGAAGRLSPEKGFDVLIDAVKQLFETGDSVSASTGIVLFGEGFLREPLQRRVDAARLGDRFKMVGFTSELDAFLPHFDLFAQSSRTEGFPCVNLEAMAARVPVVATAVGGVPEQITDGETGQLVPPDDPTALAAALRDLLENDALAGELGRRARDGVLSRFTVEKQARRYFELFQSLLDQTPPESSFGRYSGQQGG